MTINSSSILTSFQSIFIKITRTKKVIVKLIQFGTSQISLGRNQQLLIEPGKYSFYEDGTQFIENVCKQICFHLLKYFVNRNGTLNIIVEFMILQISSNHFQLLQILHVC